MKKDLENRIKAFEMRCFRRLLGIPYTANRTNESVRQEIRSYIGAYEPLLEIVRRRKLQWFGHVARHPDTLCHTILQGFVNGRKKRGRPKTNWQENVKTWTGRSIKNCYRMAEDRNEWRRIVSTAKAPPQPPTTGP